MEPIDQASFHIETLTRNKRTCTDLVKSELQSLFLDEIFALSSMVINKPSRDNIAACPHRQDMSTHFFLVLFAIFILHSRESELYRYTLDGKSALAWELPFSRFMDHLSST